MILNCRDQTEPASHLQSILRAAHGISHQLDTVAEFEARKKLDMVVICLDDPVNVAGIWLAPTLKVFRSTIDNLSLIAQRAPRTKPSSRTDRWQERSTNDILANELLITGYTRMKYLFPHQLRSPLLDQLLDIQLYPGAAAFNRDACYWYPWVGGAASPGQFA